MRSNIFFHYWIPLYYVLDFIQWCISSLASNSYSSSSSLSSSLEDSNTLLLNYSLVSIFRLPLPIEGSREDSYCDFRFLFDSSTQRLQHSNKLAFAHFPAELTCLSQLVWLGDVGIPRWVCWSASQPSEALQVWYWRVCWWLPWSGFRSALSPSFHPSVLRNVRNMVYSFLACCCWALYCWACTFCICFWSIFCIFPEILF